MDFNQLYGQFSNEIWSHFQSSELAAGRKTATFRLWVKRSKVARRTMSNYLSEHGAPQGNPYFWVQHFPEPPAPVNYFGKQLPRRGKYFTATYEGKPGLFCEADVRMYDMQDPKPFNV